MKVDALTPSTLSHGLKESSPHQDSSFWSELISRVAEKADINPRIAVLVASHESGLNPGALNQTSGAIGMMQLLPATAAGLGVNPHSVVENIVGGVKYLRQQLMTFGDTAKALAAYNWGPHHVSQAIEIRGKDWLDHAPDVTGHYVKSIVSQLVESTPIVLNSRSVEPLAPGPPSEPANPRSSSEAPPLSGAILGILQTALDAYLLSEIIK
jgi:hypothetical protein